MERVNFMSLSEPVQVPRQKISKGEPIYIVSLPHPSWFWIKRRLVQEEDVWQRGKWWTIVRDGEDMHEGQHREMEKWWKQDGLHSSFPCVVLGCPTTDLQVDEHSVFNH